MSIRFFVLGSDIPIFLKTTRLISSYKINGNMYGGNREIYTQLFSQVMHIIAGSGLTPKTGLCIVSITSRKASSSRKTAPGTDRKESTETTASPSKGSFLFSGLARVADL